MSIAGTVLQQFLKVDAKSTKRPKPFFHSRAIEVWNLISSFILLFPACIFPVYARSALSSTEYTYIILSICIIVTYSNFFRLSVVSFACARCFEMDKDISPKLMASLKLPRRLDSVCHSDRRSWPQVRLS
jgi:hypothetical protein